MVSKPTLTVFYKRLIRWRDADLNPEVLGFLKQQ